MTAKRKQPINHQPRRWAGANHSARARRFSEVWDTLAILGQCDGRGGAEYRRVYRLWRKAGEPRQIAPYIRRVANRPLPGMAAEGGG